LHGIGAGEQGSSVTILSDAQQDEIQSGPRFWPRLGESAQYLFVVVSRKVGIGLFAAHAMNAM
jgi:hypothetical protein